MLRLLLDAHISPEVARALQREGVDAVAVRDWHAGSYRSAPDAELLVVAAAEARVLVTYDCQTIPPLLKEWAESDQEHGGVVFVDERTVRADDIGGLVRALRALIARSAEGPWVNRAVFLLAQARGVGSDRP